MTKSSIQDRSQVGAYISHLRKSAGLTQMGLAKKLGYDYYSFISQIEQGTSRIPSDSYGRWADALNVAQRPFVKKLLYYYDRNTYLALFNDDPANLLLDE